MRSLMSFRGARNHGTPTIAFTLVELMIVVVIVGVLAAIAMAVVGSPLAQARETALSAGLRNFRTQLITYKVQHGDSLPDAILLSQTLLGQTDSAGNMGIGPAYPLGPYFQSFPQNPYNRRSDVKAVQAGNPLSPDDRTGWLYQVDGTSFKLVANSTGVDSLGKPLVSY